MVSAYVEIPEDGEPRIAGRRLPVLTVVLQLGGSTQSIGSTQASADWTWRM